MRFPPRVTTAVYLTMAFAACSSAHAAGPETSDQAAALLDHACADCWADGGKQVATRATLEAVAWNCAAAPCPGGGPPAETIAGSNGVSSVTGAWGGGIYNSVDKQIVVWGGGHNNYYGNEVYA